MEIMYLPPRDRPETFPQFLGLWALVWVVGLSGSFLAGWFICALMEIPYW